MCFKFGELVECRICYNPQTRKHLGLGKVVFQSERAARECCSAFNQKTKMGNVMTVFLDTMGRERAKMIDSLCNPNANLKPYQPVNLNSVSTISNTNNKSNMSSPNTMRLNSSTQLIATSSAVGSSSSPNSNDNWVNFN